MSAVRVFMGKHRTAITYGSLIVLVGTTALIVWKRKKNANMMAAISDIIMTGQGSSGDWRDLERDDVFNVNYWRGVKNKSLLPTSEAIRIAEQLKSAHKGIFSDDKEQLVLDIYASFRSKAHASQVADEFQKKYGTGLYAWLNSWMGSGDWNVLSSSDMMKLYNKVKAIKE